MNGVGNFPTSRPTAKIGRDLVGVSASNTAACSLSVRGGLDCGIHSNVIIAAHDRACGTRILFRSLVNMMSEIDSKHRSPSGQAQLV